MPETSEKPRLRLLLDHFALIEDDREAWRVAHPLPEVLLLMVCGTIAAGDDFEDIADWGHRRLGRGQSSLPAPVPALLSWRSGRALVAQADEPHRP